MSDKDNGIMDNNPAHQRKALRAPLIVLQVKLDDGRKSFFGYAKNISRSGLFIGTTNPREPGERFQVELSLPAPLGHNVRCACEVVWKRLYSKGSSYEPGMGLRFLELPEEMAKAIDGWVSADHV
jgi:uncharacterized protein (TIGR02266 family)